MRNSVVVLCMLCLAGLFAFAQDASKPTQKAAPVEFKIPPEAVKEPNPVKATPESIERGKKRWGYDCAMCHGVSGDGKGDLAADMKLQLGDYRDAKTLKDQTDGELFYIIKNGKGQMPAEGERAKADSMWDVVNYIRSLAKKEAQEKSKDPTH
jgi:mono/diheme cytochrome c family protein